MSFSWLVPQQIVWRLETVKKLQKETTQKQDNNLGWEFWINCIYEIAPTNLIEWMVVGCCMLVIGSIGTVCLGLVLGLIVFVMAICLALIASIGITCCIVLSMLSVGCFVGSLAAGSLACISILATSGYVSFMYALQIIYQILFGTNSVEELQQNGHVQNENKKSKINGLDDHKTITHVIDQTAMEE
eukprot:TRINITY_DN21377_c0_g1_i3.p3 TRINITY_DN21377_c0_g1~~TRINITY_DN21377_c0_g1_i3.p3  ORF type:complete len:187 (-),score=9.59 TRINITY_DN21377_c0_g1_i3:448-1008(-)